MIDLTRGSILRHIVSLAAPTAVFIAVQGLYFLVDLYFVAPLGDVAIAAVVMGGNVLFVSGALLQVLGIGAATLISHAAGRNDPDDAAVIFNQALSISAVCAAGVLVLGYLLTPLYIRSLTDDAATIAAGIEYLHWLIPGMVLQFCNCVVSGALRGMGCMRPTMTIYALSVLLNIVLAPVLISGWGTQVPLGVAGAGVATSSANLMAVIALWEYFRRTPTYVRVQPALLRPNGREWKRLLAIGVPAGGEMALTFAYTALTFWAIRNFGAGAQAGFGLGFRLMQMLFVPVMAVAVAVAPIAGQNFGAHEAGRVRQTFRTAATLSAVLMLAATLYLQMGAHALSSVFSQDADVIAQCATFLQIASIGFVARALVYACSGLFQGIGQTVPALASSGIAFAAFALPSILLSRSEILRLEHIWILWTATALLQAAVSLFWLHAKLQRHVEPASAAVSSRAHA